jgi:4-carboxymuconolactone decarboxylase
VLSLRERQMIRLAALTALGAGHSPLKANIEAAVRIGIPQEEIVEVFLQVLPYAGFPRVLTALETVRDVLIPPEG